MRALTVFGPFTWFAGIVILLINAFGDSGTPTPSHIDALGLGMAISGAILTTGSKDS